jgi:hypothetical protein
MAKIPRDCHGCWDRLGQEPRSAVKGLFPGAGAAAGPLAINFNGTRTLELPGASETKPMWNSHCGMAEELD